MTDTDVPTPRFVDQTAAPQRPMEFWPAAVVRGAEIDREIERLLDAGIPAGARRRSKVVHPNAGSGLGLAPGIDVAIEVLRPGETTLPWRQSSNQVAMCIRGTATAHVAGRSIGFTRHDVWNTPSMALHRYVNAGSDPAVFLSYSNAPLLEMLGIHYVEEDPPQLGASGSPANVDASDGPRAKDMAPNIPIGEDGARLLGYEHLIDIDVVPSRPLLWPWVEVSKHLGSVEGLGGERGSGYRGRHLLILYNPATERRNGTTHSFFASIAQFPPGRVDAPHRHSSAAINYVFAGGGRSTVGKQRFEWQAGDLMLSAPGWAVHNHASGPDGCNILTIQDHPLQIAMESLIWQESLKGPVLKLGAEAGAQTNLRDLVDAR